jgi:hypothetical protein
MGKNYQEIFKNRAIANLENAITASGLDLDQLYDTAYGFFLLAENTPQALWELVAQRSEETSFGLSAYELEMREVIEGARLKVETEREVEKTFRERLLQLVQTTTHEHPEFLREQILDIIELAMQNSLANGDIRSLSPDEPTSH